MAKKTTNLGVVKAIFVGAVAPSNINVLWYDTTVNLHKAYNVSTSSWELIVGLVLIDNATIKRNGLGQLYVDETTLAGYVLANGSVTLLKMADVAEGTVFYRKTAGTGPPEVQTLAQLKADLGLTGTNSGDQNLSIYALKTYTVNGKALSGNITLTPADIGSPSGSGTSSGANTGDETAVTIKSKLGITVLSGNNTGDQDASTILITDAGEIFLSGTVEAALAEVKLIADQNKIDITKAPYIEEITLPAYASVALRCSNAVAGVDYPTGWVLVAGASEYDLKITHGLNKNFVTAEVWEVNGDGTERALPSYSAAYTGKLQSSKNEILIEGLTQDTLPLRIELIFKR